MSQEGRKGADVTDESGQGRPSKKTRVAFLTWKRLSLLGNIQFLRVSYAVLVIVPVVASVQSVALGDLFEGAPLTMRLGYFASLLLSFAHMIYQGFCPQIIKRFESPNDLYRSLLEIKALQHQYLAADAGFTFDIHHCREGFDKANRESWAARVLCGLFYLVGVALVAWVALERSLIVLGV